jgi:hypothetical protein
MSIIALAALTLALLPPTFAQNQSTKDYKQPVQTAIRAARLLDVEDWCDEYLTEIYAFDPMLAHTGPGSVHDRLHSDKPAIDNPPVEE